jgi:large subunit ribosomal protein L23Ae
MQNHPGHCQKLYNMQAAMVNTLIRPDGKKKAYICLTTDDNVLNVANKVCATEYTY